MAGGWFAHDRKMLSVGLAQLFYWFGNCAALGYLVPYMAQNGIASDVIGTIFSISAGAGFLLQLLLGRLADAGCSVTRMVGVLAGILAAVSLRLFLGDSFIPALFLLHMAETSLASLLDMLVLQIASCGSRPSFGALRSAGSIGYAVSSLLVGLLLLRVPLSWVFLFNAAALIGLIFTLPRLTDNDTPSNSARNAHVHILSRSGQKTVGRLLLCVIMFVLISIASRANATYFPLLLYSQGGSSLDLGIIYFLMAVGEAPAMRLSDHLQVRYSIKLTIFASLFFYLLRYILLLNATERPLLYLSQLLQALSYGIFFPVFLSWIQEIAPDPFKSTVLTLTLSSGKLLGGVFGPILAGQLIEFHSLQAYPLVCCICTVAALLIAAFIKLPQSSP